MAESAALLVDEVFPDQPVRQWVLSIPIPLRFSFAARPSVTSGVLGLVNRCLSSWVIKQAGLIRNTGRTGAVTLIQRFGSALTKLSGTILNSRRLAPQGVGQDALFASCSCVWSSLFFGAEMSDKLFALLSKPMLSFFL